jgi:GntR family transcriptional regulator, transcriptional repressor for pyruvate dehydrogenase complex
MGPTVGTGRSALTDAALKRDLTISSPPAAPVFPLLEKTPVGLLAVQAIQSLIIDGQLKPGDALPAERDLAASLGISRPSLREAIRALNTMNLLETRHGGGTFVTSLDPQLLVQPINFLLRVDRASLSHLFDVRIVLEVGAARLAAPRITDMDVAHLEGLAAAADSALNDPSRYIDLDFQIHTAIVEATGNPIYLSLYRSIADLSIESRKRTARRGATRRRAHEDHLAIVAALRQRDPDAAASAMHDHLSGIRDGLQASLARSESGNK